MPISKSRQSNWLEKLRKVNGIPTVDDGQGMDHFLSLQQQRQQQEKERADDVDNYLHPIRRRDSQPRPKPHIENDVSVRMANMLSNLFSDGGCGGGISNFKAPRKQANPKMCVFAASVEDRGSNGSDRVVEDGDFGRKDEIQKRNRNVNLKAQQKVPRGMEKGRRLEDCDLVGFSRTEVSIIDSSSPLWKFDKYLFRKKNVWKARDYRNVRPRSSHSVAIERKKKREAFDDDDDDDCGAIVRQKSKTFGSRK